MPVHLTNDEFLLDPLRAMKRARAGGSAVTTDMFPVAVAYDAVRDALVEPRLEARFNVVLAALGITSGPFFEWMSISPLNCDGATHKAWRAHMTRTFTPRSVEALRPYLKARSHELIDRFAARGSCELVAEFADLLPSDGLGQLIGVPAEDRDRFRAWANTIGLGFNVMLLPTNIARVDDALTHLLDYARELLARRRAQPQDDLVTRLAQLVDELRGTDGALTDHDICGWVAGLVFAGHETTRNQLGWLVTVIADRPDVWDAVGSGVADVAPVVEEALRLRSTVTSAGRVAAADCEIGGVSIPAGSIVLQSLWSANRDEAVFPKPDEFDPAANGAAAAHMAFGHGPHHCLGAALARAELQEALVALSSRLHCPTIGAGAVWRPPLGINGPDVLPLDFAARA